MTKQYQLDGPDGAPLLILAHGAGAGSDSEFMQQVAQKIASYGVQVARFDFPYMEQSKQDGKRRPPQKAPALLADYRALIAQLDRPCVIGGKSMGGRMASLLMQDAPEQVKGCVCLGYPFHPPGKPDNLRTEHLAQLSLPLLMVQGTRDTMGTKEEVAGYILDSSIHWQWLEDGNHDLKPRKASGFSHEDHINSAAKAAAEFVKSLL